MAGIFCRGILGEGYWIYVYWEGGEHTIDADIHGRLASPHIGQTRIGYDTLLAALIRLH